MTHALPIQDDASFGSNAPLMLLHEILGLAFSGSGTK